MLTWSRGVGRMGVGVLRQMSEVGVAPPADASEPTVFDRILAKEIPVTVLHEDDLCMAFVDANPVAPTHFLVIPRKRISQVSNATEDDKALLGHLLYTASAVAKDQGLDDGFRLVINNGQLGCQSVYHLHVHCIGGAQLTWPPGGPADA